MRGDVVYVFRARLLCCVESDLDVVCMCVCVSGPTKRLVFYKPFIEALETLVPPHGVQHEVCDHTHTPTHTRARARKNRIHTNSV